MPNFCILLTVLVRWSRRVITSRILGSGDNPEAGGRAFVVAFALADDDDDADDEEEELLELELGRFP